MDKLRIDPQDPARIEMTFSVQSDLPVKTDSKAKIMSLSPLGDNHLEIVPGSAQAALAKDGAQLVSEDVPGLQRADEKDQRHRAGRAAVAAHTERPGDGIEGDGRSRERSVERAEPRKPGGNAGQHAGDD